jgi:hypothetical protein
MRGVEEARAIRDGQESFGVGYPIGPLAAGAADLLQFGTLGGGQ